MKEYTQVTFNIEPRQHEVLTALLSNFPFETFEEEESKLNAYIQSAELDKHQLESYLQSIPTFASVQPSYVIYQPRDWNEEWQKNFEPINIDNKIAIRAPFHEKIEPVAYDILIEPRMSFGTGHHATTALMLKLIYGKDLRGKYVVDYGCGTGILAIFAAMKGAEPVVAFDNNEWAYDNTPLNCRLNQIDSIHVKLAGSDELRQHQPDVILANINRPVLVENMQVMSQQLQPGGSLLLSGILRQDRQIIETAAEARELIKTASEEMEDWVALEYVKPRNLQ